MLDIREPKAPGNQGRGHQAEYPHLTWAELPWIHRQRLGTTFTQRKRAAAPHIYSRCATSCPNFWIYV
jgi:hypothetical protein